MLESYIIIAIAFAIVMQIRYVFEVLGVIRDVEYTLDLDKRNFNPILFSIGFFIFTTLLMPIMSLYIFLIEKDTVIKDISGAILKTYHGLGEEK